MKNVVLALLLSSFAPSVWAESPLVHVEMLSRPNGLEKTWTLQGINGRKLLCPDTGVHAKACVVDQVIAPADCDWECQDGVLSGQGRSVFQGRFENAQPRIFRVEAAWDSWSPAAIRGPLYRITKAEAGYRLEQVGRQKKARTFSVLDFSRTDDVNFQMDPTRADDMLGSPLGLLATGQWQGARFRIDQIWRQWSPRLTCDVWSIAKARAFPEGSQDITMIFGTEEEVTTFKDPDGKSVRWLIWEREEAGAVTFRSGIDGLWAEVFSVAHRGCSVTVLAEH